MAWRRPGDKPLSEPLMVSFLTHICVTRPQWVKWTIHVRCNPSAAGVVLDRFIRRLMCMCVSSSSFGKVLVLPKISQHHRVDSEWKVIFFLFITRIVPVFPYVRLRSARPSLHGRAFHVTGHLWEESPASGGSTHTVTWAFMFSLALA